MTLEDNIARLKRKYELTRERNKDLGFWRYSCGCIQYQDGWDYCDFHKGMGYETVLGCLKGWDEK